MGIISLLNFVNELVRFFINKPYSAAFMNVLFISKLNNPSETPLSSSFICSPILRVNVMMRYLMLTATEPQRPKKGFCEVDYRNVRLIQP